ncbi:MAG TPA: formate dehydrogenase subunit gamma [Chromatiales bacterium]|nr:formate dehydrogenase subunit gamma [Thiotrichales bacterium]HIP67051.1 formate dehydrogenase subunit gamma [Chromatiales bacterium]
MLRSDNQRKNIFRTMIYVLFSVVLLWVLGSANNGYAESSSESLQVIPVPNPAADLWRAVRQREGSIQATSTQVRSVDSGVLITETGEKFRTVRRARIIPYLPYLLAVSAGLILLFYFIRGQIKIADGHAGEYVVRFKNIERMVHWFVASLFIFLALTGLILLFGRFVIIPVFGKEAFSLIASACKESHNLVGPLFLVGVVLLFFLFVSRNILAKGDLRWLLKGGGFGRQHVKAGFFNMGEKIWFWLVITLGLTVSISGLILDFPVFEQSRWLMQLSLIVHGIAAVIFISISFGHIYLGTIGTEGTLRGMTSGKVDVNWAKTHHDLWYEKLSESEKTIDEDEPVLEKPDGESATIHT